MSDQGRFAWYELMTTDTTAANAFYGQVVGWTAQDAPMPGMTYTLFSTGETQVGGMMALPDNLRAMGVPPHWSGYVGVEDVDASAEKAKALGGELHHEPTDIPGVGRFAVVADPQGATICLFKWLTPAQPRPVSMGEKGRVGWHELLTTDIEKAFAFYHELFGWTKNQAHDMGPMGIYQTFSEPGQTDGMIGGMMKRPPDVPASFWVYYFIVDDIDAAAERIKNAGGQIAHGPMEVPGGSWVIQAFDPQKALFALVGTRK